MMGQRIQKQKCVKSSEQAIAFEVAFLFISKCKHAIQFFLSLLFSHSLINAYLVSSSPRVQEPINHARDEGGLCYQCGGDQLGDLDCFLNVAYDLVTESLALSLEENFVPISKAEGRLLGLSLFSNLMDLRETVPCVNLVLCAWGLAV